MADSSTPKDHSFLRKVARFVANPATDWADLNAPQDENRELELEKSELKAMVERKRRNDFVRRREFDMLRRVRREGLSPEQLAALGSSSRLDEDSDRGAETQPGHHGSGNVKAKIDAIEKQMVGGGTRPTPLQAPMPRDDATVSTSPAVMGRAMNPVPPPAVEDDDDLLPALPPLPPDEDDRPRRAAPVPMPAHAGPGAASTPAPAGHGVSTGAALPATAAVAKGAGLPPLTPGRQSRSMTFGESQPFEIGEVMHDPELDPAVIAFANADFDDCERMLMSLSKKGGLRGDHADTWLTLFDFYRATGQQQKFDNLAMIYAEQFSRSAPQWLSLPKLVADAAAADAPKRTAAHGRIDIGWVCPGELDAEGVAKLASVTLQLPMPWVLDWTAVRQVDAQAAGELATLFRQWGARAVEMRWVHGERLLDVLQDHAPAGARDADPAFWMARLEALRLANRPDQFDETAIEYCITYEVSPPSWEPAKAIARMGNGEASTESPSLLQITATAISTMHDGATAESADVASLELSGQLVGDIASTLQRLNDEIADASIVKVSCARLIRVDFIAAGDLLNWVMNKRQQQRMITFTDAHRLVALFFGAMGITENAGVRVRIN